MSDEPEEPSAASTFALEVVVAVAILAFGAVIAFDSYRLGAGWGDDGPKTGYFPFYIGLILCLASVVNLIRAMRTRHGSGDFVSVPRLKLVMAMLIPSVIYVAAMVYIGIYISSAVFIAIFMVWQGKFAVWKSILTGVAVSVLLFLTFEIWFKIALYKGPFEAWLGY